MSSGFFRSRTNQAALITGACVIIAAIIGVIWQKGKKPESVANPLSIDASPSASNPTGFVVVAEVPFGRQKTVADSLAQIEHLRPLAPLETGRATTPPGTFFWVSPIYLARNGSGRDRDFGGDPSPLFPNQYFRVHHLLTGERIMLAYLTDENAGDLAAGVVNASEVTIFPAPWKHFSTLVLIPFDRVKTAHDRELTLENGLRQSVLDVVLQ